MKLPMKTMEMIAKAFMLSMFLMILLPIMFVAFVFFTLLIVYNFFYFVLAFLLSLGLVYMLDKEEKESQFIRRKIVKEDKDTGERTVIKE